MVDKKLFFLLIIALIIPLALAQDNLGNFEQNKNISLSIICDNCTAVNITTITFPNSTIRNVSTQMDKNVNSYNYSFGSTSALGNYFYTTCGDPNGIVTCESVSFEVTTIGSNVTTGQSLLYVIALIGMFGLFGLSLWGAIKLPFGNWKNPEGHIIGINDLKYLKIFCIVISYIILMFIFAILKRVTEVFLFWNGAYRLFNWAYWIMFSFMFPLIIISIIFTIILFLTSQRLKKALTRGLPAIR